MSYAFIFKYIIVGDAGVGKSCIVLQFINKRFRSEHDITIGVEFGTKNIIAGKKEIKLQIWDTAGSEAFKSITRTYYKGVACALLVYDITKRDSYANVSGWLDDLKQNGSEGMQIVLIGNKSDMEMKEVSYEEANKFAAEHNILFLECSAKTGSNIEEIFTLSAGKILDKIEHKEIDPLDEKSGIKPGLKSGFTKSLVDLTNKEDEKYRKKCCKS